MLVSTDMVHEKAERVAPELWRVTGIIHVARKYKQTAIKKSIACGFYVRIKVSNTVSKSEEIQVSFPFLNIEVEPFVSILISIVLFEICFFFFVVCTWFSTVILSCQTRIGQILSKTQNVCCRNGNRTLMDIGEQVCIWCQLSYCVDWQN